MTYAKSLKERIGSVSQRHVFWIMFYYMVTLLVRGDGYFPLPKDINPWFFRSIVLLETTLVTVFSTWMAFILLFQCPLDEIKPNDWKKSLWIICGSFALIFFLHIAQEKRYAVFGYPSQPVVLLIFMAFAAAVLLVLWRKNTFVAMLL